jgi:hypothetical protein
LFHLVLCNYILDMLIGGLKCLFSSPSFNILFCHWLGC